MKIEHDMEWQWSDSFMMEIGIIVARNFEIMAASLEKEEEFISEMLTKEMFHFWDVEKGDCSFLKCQQRRWFMFCQPNKTWIRKPQKSSKTEQRNENSKWDWKNSLISKQRYQRFGSHSNMLPIIFDFFMQSDWLSNMTEMCRFLFLILYLLLLRVIFSPCSYVDVSTKLSSF